MEIDDHVMDSTAPSPHVNPKYEGQGCFSGLTLSLPAVVAPASTTNMPDKTYRDRGDGLISGLIWGLNHQRIFRVLTQCQNFTFHDRLKGVELLRSYDLTRPNQNGIWNFFSYLI